MKSQSGVVFCLLVAGLFAFSGCGTEGSSATGTRTKGTKYQVVATTAMVADIVKQVAGDKAEVLALMGEGTDPHGYDPTRSDINQVRSADVVFYSGLMLEAKMTEVFEHGAAEGRPYYAVTDKLHETYQLIYPTKGHPDPHVWMDVAGWSKCVGRVAEALKQFDKPNAAYYQANAENYQKELTKLHDYVKQVIASIPQDQRVLITAHDAFSYFSRAYGIAVHAPQGVDTTQEASVADINRLVDVIVERKIPSLFTEDSVNEKNLNAILSGVRARGGRIEKAGKKLYSDSMGPAGSYEGTYIGMLDHNATVIARELGNKNAPEKGLNGKLSRK